MFVTLRGGVTEGLRSGRPEDDDRLGALHRSGGLDVARLRCVHARVDNRRSPQNMASTVPTTLAMRGTAKAGPSMYTCMFRRVTTQVENKPCLLLSFG